MPVNAEPEARGSEWTIDNELLAGGSVTKASALLHRALLSQLLLLPMLAYAEDGYDLWLRYAPVSEEARPVLARQAAVLVGPDSPSPTVKVALDELRRGLSAMLSRDVSVSPTIIDGAILIGTPQTLPDIPVLDEALRGLGPEGYAIRSVETGGFRTTVVAANDDSGVLYGAFALLRLAQAGRPLDPLDVAEAPSIKLRLLNHWDNLDRSVERGYAGQSIWDWWRLPEHIDPRYRDYARANASIGINGTVLNNVNAQPEVLTSRYIAKAAALADVLRPYGIRVYLAVRFTAPAEAGGLDTADPLNPRVRAWWADKAAEIYEQIPDFGGFLVKANAEGQPGPQNFGRTHADGANMLSAALEPYGGVVMWRAFVYSQDNPEDRVKQAWQEFTPLDGEFAANVLVQVKNGPLDFQPREPFHPLFGAMPRTPLMMEFQITQEYLGFSTHLVYLGPLYEEALDADTFALGQGSRVSSVVDGSLHGRSLSGIAGVANTGSDRDWTGSSFAQANWYAFGRLAWNPALTSRDIAEEWLRMTFSREPEFVRTAARMMMRSREAAVDYMTPLGLAHLMGTGHHYGPAPWVDSLGRPEWNPFYYHRADTTGIGFDRSAEGSGAAAQYAAPVARRFGKLDLVPDKYLLWFHRLPWNHRMRSGLTLWEELLRHYDKGVAEVKAMQEAWAGLQQFVDRERFVKTTNLLAVQAREARWWRDACIAYFQERSGLDLPRGVRAPPESLQYYMDLEFPHAPGH